MKRCPHCGQMMPFSTSATWLMELRYLARAKYPLWGSLLDGRWRNDPDLPRWVDAGWATILPDQGFVITDAGLAELKRNNISVD